MENIKHIVYLMLENRSLDQLLGWLYADSNPSVVLPPGSNPVFNGLNTGNYFNTDQYGTPYFAQKIDDPARNQVPSEDPHEDYIHVNYQLFSSQQNPVPNTRAQMSGFLRDYADQNKDARQIMDCYSPKGLKYINALARLFAVSDAYYSSLPTQTNCNRGFAGSGSSIGTLDGKRTAMVDNHWGPSYLYPWDPFMFTGKTIWNVLSENGFAGNADWMIYYSQLWPGHEVGDYCYTQDLFWPSIGMYSNFSPIENFFEQAKTGELPSFSFLEPAWFEIVDGVGWNGNDYHPPANLSPGEAFLKRIFDALVSSPCWKETLLIINFDEHGGTYDHVSPPWGAIAPWADPAEGTEVPEAYENGFRFDRFGVRVPLILVSPYVEWGTVFRAPGDIPFDHTSVIATILEHFGIPRDKWKLGSRVANAPTFDFVLNGNAPRLTFPQLHNIEIEPGRIENVAVNELQRMISYRALLKAAKKVNCPVERFAEIHQKYFASVHTVTDLYIASRKVMEEICN